MSFKKTALFFFLLILCRNGFSLDANLESAYGRSLFTQGKYEEARKILENIFREGTAGPLDMAVLGMWYNKLKDFKKAPLNNFIHLAVGSLAFEQGEFEKAFTHFNLVERFNPGSRQAIDGMVACLVNRGIILFRENKPGEARKLFREALTFDPDAMPVLKNLGVLELEKGDSGLAAEYFRKALKYAPADAELIRLFITARRKEKNEAGFSQGGRDGNGRTLSLFPAGRDILIPG